MTKRVVLVLLGVGLCLTVLAASGSVCSVCKKKISGNYLKSSDGTLFCGRTCAAKVAERCAACKKPVKGEYFKHKGKAFCSQGCLQSVMPKCSLCTAPMKGWTVVVNKKFCSTCSKFVRCADCMRPFAKGKKYEDGRAVCNACLKTVITKKDDVAAFFVAARAELKKLTGLQTKELPEIVLASNKDIVQLAEKQMGARPAGIIRGFYQRTEHFVRKTDPVPNKVDKKIYVLYGMRKETYAVTAIHELTHDLIAEKFPRLKGAPSWVHEGICQYNAYTVALKYKLSDHSAVISQHPDASYGDGFRSILRTFGPGNWKKLEKWMKTIDVKSLPKAAPTPKS